VYVFLWLTYWFTDELKTPEQAAEEKRILDELLEVVEEKNILVKMIEEDRVRYSSIVSLEWDRCPVDVVKGTTKTLLESHHLIFCVELNNTMLRCRGEKTKLINTSFLLFHLEWDNYPVDVVEEKITLLES